MRRCRPFQFYVLGLLGGDRHLDGLHNHRGVVSNDGNVGSRRHRLQLGVVGEWLTQDTANDAVVVDFFMDVDSEGELSVPTLMTSLSFWKYHWLPNSYAV